MATRLSLGVTACAALAALAGCSGPASTADALTSSITSDTAVQRLTLTYDTPVVGAAVTASAMGLSPGAEVELEWATVSGGWVIEDYYHFRGKQYEDIVTSLGSFLVDQDGRLEAQFAIPEDYGGVHDVMAVVDGRTVAQNGIEVTQSFELTPTSGPVGTPIELTVKGLGWRTMESTWAVNWDNNAIGWVSAAGTHGSAVARFRAAGPPGDHAIKVYTGYQGQPYLNYEQSTGRASAPTAVHLPHDAGARVDDGGVRGAVSDPAGAGRGDQPGRRDGRADADAGPRRNRGATDSHRFPEGSVAGSRVADLGRQSG